jgi:flagellar motor switch protein FliG
MMNISANLRKAAVLLRSVDADTAATLLSQLSTDEAMGLRDAMRALGVIDPAEQADVLAEFRRERPLASEPANHGVELSLSSTDDSAHSPLMPDAGPSNKRFEFLENASAKTLASFLSREHAQTIAVVLSHLPPPRAAAVLAALPERVQAETMERLSNLGDTDSDAVAILENELAAWVKAQCGNARQRGRRRDTVASILAAADAKTRNAVVAKLKTRDAEFFEPAQPVQRERARVPSKPRNDEYRIVRSIARRHQLNGQLSALVSEPSPAPAPRKLPPPSRPALPQIDFDHLIHLDSRMLAQLLEVADPNLLALALAGSRDELVERICDQMPKRVAKAFRRELRRIGPTRLSDMEAAQRAIAELAARQIASRQAQSIHSAPMLNA